MRQRYEKTTIRSTMLQVVVEVLCDAGDISCSIMALTSLDFTV